MQNKLPYTEVEITVTGSFLIPNVAREERRLTDAVVAGSRCNILTCSSSMFDSSSRRLRCLLRFEMRYSCCAVGAVVLFTRTSY
jgi:hypothetical protein